VLLEQVLAFTATKAIEVCLRLWEDQQRRDREVRLRDHQTTKFRHILESAIQLGDEDERRRQVSPLIRPLQDLAHEHRVQGAHDGWARANLGLAAAYAAIGESDLHVLHLNRACDGYVRILSASEDADERTRARLARDELIAVLGSERVQVVEW
jgi:hypothetical protein